MVKVLVKRNDALTAIGSSVVAAAEKLIGPRAIGKTSLKRLYAVGEGACTGVHGANRLASTSLLECLVWGYFAGKDAIED